MRRVSEMIKFASFLTLPSAALIFTPYAARPWIYASLALMSLISFWYTDQQKTKTATRLRRRNLGLCIKCGYDIRGNSSACSECGTPIERPEKPAASAWDVAAVARRYVITHSVKATQPRTFEPIVLSEIDAMDHIFLKKQTSDLFALGFRSLGELITGLRSKVAFCVFVSEDGRVIATVGSVINLEISYWIEAKRYIGFQSELSDETFVVTSVILCPQKFQIHPRAYPGIDELIRWDRIDACELLNLHQQRLAKKIEEVPTRSVVPCHTLSDGLASQRRLELKKCVHQITLKYPDEATLRAAFPNRSEEWLTALFIEMNRLKEEEEGKNDASESPETAV